jgi:hypothetical protein
MLVNFLLGKRDLLNPEEIAEQVKNAPEFNATKENPATANLLLLFKTSRQQTWLVVTPERLYCILDDVREPRPEVRWSIAKAEIISNGELILPISVREHSRNSGRLDIGSHKNWLFSKALFAAIPVQEAITALIRKQMIDAQARAYA